MNAKNWAQLTVLVLIMVWSQLAGQDQAPQWEQTYTLDNLSELSYPLGKEAPDRKAGAGSR